jgi:hypothetical protein
MSNVKAMPANMSEAVYVGTSWVFEAQIGTTREDMERPDFWSLVSARMRPFDEITVRAQDGTFFSKMIVLACDRAWAKVKVLHWHDLTTPDVSQTEAKLDDFMIEYKGERKHCVIRKSDGAILQDGFHTKTLAGNWLTSNMAVLT